MIRSADAPLAVAADAELKICPEKAVTLLDEARPMLLAIARELIAPDLQAKFGASDIVQETCIEAVRDLPAARAMNRAQWLGWLKTLLRNNFLDASRAFRETSKRRISREDATVDEGLMDQGGDAWEQLLAKEEIERMLSALRELPIAAQRVLFWKFRQRMSYAAIAERIDRSEDAVRRMTTRTLCRLRRRLVSEDESA